MPAYQILIIVLCGVLGYWLVSRLMKGGDQTDAGTEPGASSAADGRQEHESFGWEQQAGAHDAPAAWHEVLGVSPSASPDEIKRAYRALITKYHPDRVDGMAEDVRALCEHKSRIINAAYNQAMGKGN